MEIQSHSDGRADKVHSLYWSQRRAGSVAKALQQEGVDASRLSARGLGRAAPIYDDSQCLGPDEALSVDCRTMTSRNRRMVFRVVRVGAPPPRPITGALDGNASLLPSKEGALRTGANVLPSHGVLPTKGVLSPNSVLPAAGENAGLPRAKNVLPDQGVLPRQGTPRKPDEPAPAPK